MQYNLTKKKNSALSFSTIHTLGFIGKCCHRRCLQLNHPSPPNQPYALTARPSSHLSDTDPTHGPGYNNVPHPSLQSSTVVWLEMRLTTAWCFLPGATRANYISLTTPAPPNLSPVEWKNVVPLAASPGTEHANGVWSLSQARANLAWRGLWRIKPDEIYIWSSSKRVLFHSAVPHQEGREFSRRIPERRCIMVLRFSLQTSFISIDKFKSSWWKHWKWKWFSFISHRFFLKQICYSLMPKKTSTVWILSSNANLGQHWPLSVTSYNCIQ